MGTWAGQRSGIWRLVVILCLVALVLSGIAGCQMLFQPLAGPQGVNIEPTPDEPRVLRIVACWESLPLLNDLEARYRAQYPNIILQIEAMESALARQTLDAGQADLALVIDDPVPLGVTGTQIQVGGTQQQVVARDALVIAVASTSPLAALSSAQLRDLYAGRIMDWAVIGGGNGRPEFVTRETGSASRRLFESQVMRDEAISTAAVVMPSDSAVRDYLIQHPDAIGYLSLTYVDAHLKTVSLDGQIPSTATIKSGRYPLIRSITALLAPKPLLEAQRWLAMATSSQGCQLMQHHYACAR